MKRSGFTMVELIFVIIIIGILSVAAIPKFGDIRDRAKVNAEYAELSGLDGALTAAREFHNDDFGNIGVLWHNQDGADSADAAALTAKYVASNTGKKVLKKVIKKGENLNVVAYLDLNDAGAAADNNMQYDVIFIEGKASDTSNGVKQSDDGDTAGKPDKNDFWVFNSSPIDVNITGANISAETEVLSGELLLIDATDTVTYGTAGQLQVKSSDGTTLAATDATLVN